MKMVEFWNVGMQDCIPTFPCSHILTFENGLTEMTNPERPNSSQQAYRLTEKGYAAVA